MDGSCATSVSAVYSGNLLTLFRCFGLGLRIDMLVPAPRVTLQVQFSWSQRSVLRVLISLDHGAAWSPGILCLLMARAPSGVLEPAECFVYGPSSETRSNNMRSTSEALQHGYSCMLMSQLMTGNVLVFGSCYTLNGNGSQQHSLTMKYSNLNINKSTNNTIFKIFDSSHDLTISNTI